MVNLTTYKLELVREKSGRYDLSKKISSPLDAVEIVNQVLNLSSSPEEQVILLSLTTKNEVTGIFTVSQGSINFSFIHPREVFKRAILNNAHSIILVHNHPSGDVSPSKEDLEMTSRIREAGELLGVPLLDHIIVGDSKAYSIIGETQFDFN